MQNEIQWGSYYGKNDIIIIQEFQNKIGFKFPISYVEIIRDFDSARVLNDKDGFDFYSNLTDKIENYGIGCFLSFNSKNSENIYRCWENRNKDPEFPFPENIIPFSLDGGGNLICFDYRHDVTTNEPKIVVWHHEGEPGTKEEISFVANSFDELLNMLHE